MLLYLERGLALYGICFVLLMGICSKWLTNHTYKKLLLQTESFSAVKDRGLKQLKNRYESTWRLNGGVHNIPVFIEKQLGLLGVWGIRLRRLDSLTLPLALLCFLVGMGSSLLIFLYNGSLQLMVTQFAAGVLAGIVLVAIECLLDTGSKKELLFIQIQDYLENNLEVQLKQPMGSAENASETAAPAKKKSMKDDIFMKMKEEQNSTRRNRGKLAQFSEEDSYRHSEAEDSYRRGDSKENSYRRSESQEEKTYRERDKDIEFLRRSLEQIAAAREQQEKTPAAKNLSSEEERLMEEIIKEYLNS